MRLLLLCALLCLAAFPAGAATAPPPPGPPRPPVHAFRTNEPIVIDGALDEEVWKGPPSAQGLLQEQPQQGQPESQGTDIWVAYDNDAIYVAARMHDSHPDSVVARLARRDNLSGSDAFMFMVDTFRDKRTGYYFGLSAAGTLVDGVLLNDGGDDDSWDGVWSGRVRRDAQGWTVEMRVPFSQLRFLGGENMVWGVNFQRVVSRRNEDDKLVFTPRSESGFVSRFPELEGLTSIQARRTLELLPYVTGKAEYLQHEPGDPYHDGANYLPTAGLDLRTSLGPKLTLNGTVNPDFGQVEIDPAVVNLSDVESYFQDKRPFFTEGLSVFRCGNNGASDYWGFNWPEPTFFYSRRIGGAPGGEMPGDAAYTDVPLAVRILGAAKITGQPKAGFNFGTLHALTGKETGDFQRDDGTRGSTPVEPLTYHGVLRGLRSFNKERQGFGLMALETARSFDGTGLNDQFNLNGLTGVVDGWTALDPRKQWVASGYFAATRVDGTPARIASVQSSSRHYFQRPDRPDLGVETDATHMSGAAGRVWVNREKGPWMSNSAIGFISPGFENNDLGFLSRTDVVNSHLGIGYNWNKPSRWRQRWYVIGAVAASVNFAGQRTMSEVYLGSNLEQKNALSWDGSVGWSAQSLSDRATRGGPAMLSPQGGWGNLYFDTNGKSKLFFYASVSPNWDVAGSHEMPIELGVTYKPSSNLSVSVGPSFGVSVNDAMYVTQTADPTATQTYGGRYVFAQLEQRTVAGELRMDYSLTPSLSIQLYAQPLVSSGQYTRYRELARPNSYEFLRYGQDGGSTLDLANGVADPDGPGGPAPPIDIGHPDFTYSTVRGNLVLRWEYLPGSTAYVVWTQDRTGPDTGGEFNLKPTLSELARTPSNNVFMVKVSHHFEI